MVRFSRILVALVALSFALPGSALAGSLLTGYSRSGGGEQQVLGPGLLPAKHGDGGIRAASRPVSQVAAAPAPTRSPTPSPNPKPTASHPAAPAAHHTTPATPAASRPAIAPGTPTTSAAPQIALPAVLYPDSAAHAGAGLPLSGAGLGLAMLAILGLVALAVTTRRVSYPSG